MSGLSHEEVRHHVKVYVRVFVALAFLTVVTVAVSYVHMPLAAAVGVALLIAAIKASLVASFFMHLASERKIILAILALTMFFFLFLLLYPTLDRF